MAKVRPPLKIELKKVMGRVIGLDLSGEHIIGGFNNSSSLFSLVHLQKLNLNDNYFNTSIPSGFSKLEKLTYLNLSMAGFLGQIPAEISQLTRLVTLDLSFISYSTKPQIPNLQKFIQNLTKIRKLYLDDISITSQGHEWSNALFPLRDLQELSLYNCDLSGPLDSSLTKLENLSIIILDGPSQNITSHLMFLDISFNNIYGTISPALITMTSTLLAINLMNNNLNGVIPDMFPTSCALSTLNFNGNRLHGPIPQSLSHCSSLEVLDIGSNQLFGGFPCFLKNIPTLSVLVLRNNRLHGSIECSHSLENKPWKMIQIVDIAFNNFKGKLPEKFFTALEKMMHDEDHGLSGFIHAGTLYYFYQDSVTVSTKGQQLEFVKILKIFTVIDFSSNHFEGSIPEVLMDFKAIHVLNFSNNALSGEIPSTIGKLKQLESLDLSNNSLVGEIPMQIASLSFLSCLNVSFNRLVGKIPTGTQLQSFQASAFEGNDGLYGPPLTEKPDVTQDMPPQPSCGRLVCSNNRKLLSVELGFVFGLVIIIGPIMFRKKWRVGYWKLVDKILCSIFSRVYLEYATNKGQTYTVLRWRYR
ncbi:receptor-like protein kinase [Trifolium pratense]|uniref:Receptor-like protein kinase n=1 Tax=Trifolium pratense TaxID=57577 RepID=A0A2K3NNK1_TRIPR|nr:receptor-like protein kinase [Trifolium pratense]